MKSSMRLRFLQIITPLLAMLGAGLFTYSYMYSFDESVRYLNPSPSVTAMEALGIVMFLVSFLPLFLLPKGSVAFDLPLGGIRGLTALFGGVLTIASVVFSLPKLIVNGVPSSRYLPILAVLCFGMTLILLFLSFVNKKMTAVAAFGIVAIAVFLILLLVLYFDTFVAVNGPIKTAIQLSILATLFLGLTELRAVIGREMPRLRLTVAMLTAFTCFPTAMAHLVFAFTTAKAFESFFVGPVYSIPLFAMGIYAVSVMLEAREC